MAGAKPGFLTLRGGVYKGRRLAIPADGSVRPTTDRAREQAFDLIGQHFRLPDGRARWAGAKVLDAFAGTGALGLEAVSRGAGHLWAWDTSGREAVNLTGIARNFTKAEIEVARQSALHPPKAPMAMDLVFLDPPYSKGWVASGLKALVAAGWVEVSTLIYAETEASSAMPQGYDLLAERITASSCLRLLRLN